MGLRRAFIAFAVACATVAALSCGDDTLTGVDAGSDAQGADAARSEAGRSDGGFRDAASADAALEASENDGALQPFVCPPLYDFDAGDAAGFRPSNFDPTTIDASATVDVDLTDVDGGCLFDTDALTFTCAGSAFSISATSVDQDGAPPAAVFAVGAFTIEQGVTVRAEGARPLVIDAQGPVRILGALHAAAFDPGYRDSGSGIVGPSGANPDPSGVTGGGCFCGLVGGATADTRYGSALLIPLQGGSGSMVGGGAIQITSANSIVIGKAGAIVVNGGGARNSAGGSGGAILLEAPTVTVLGELAANGGSGGGFYDVGGFVPLTGLGSTDVSQAGEFPAAEGGIVGGGSAGDDPNGDRGGTADRVAPGTPVPDGLFIAGGGGAGWITIKARACAAGGLVSPTLKSGCANLLPLASQ